MLIPVRPRGRSSWSIGLAVRDADLAGMTGASRGRPVVHPGVESRGGRGSAGDARGGAPGLLPRCTGLPSPWRPRRVVLFGEEGEPPGHVAARGQQTGTPGGEVRGHHRGGLPVQLPPALEYSDAGMLGAPSLDDVPRGAFAGRDAAVPGRTGATSRRAPTRYAPGTPTPYRTNGPARGPLQHEHPEPAGAVHGDGAHLQRSTRSTPAARCRARSPRCGGVPSLEGAVPRGTRYDRRGSVPSRQTGSTANASGSSSMRPDDRGRLPRPGWSLSPRLLAGTRQPAPRGVGPGAPLAPPGRMVDEGLGEGSSPETRLPG